MFNLLAAVTKFYIAVIATAFAIMWFFAIIISWFIMPFKVIYDWVCFAKRKELDRDRLIAIISFLVAYVVIYAGVIVYALTSYHQGEDSDAVILIGIESMQIVISVIYNKIVWNSLLPFKWMRKKQPVGTEFSQ